LGKKIKQNEITRFSFKINFAAFQNVEKGGRQAALIWLSPSLTFYFLGLLIWLLRFLFSIRIFSHLSALATSIIALAMFFLFLFLLHKIYIRNDRSIGKIGYRVFYIMMMPLMLVGSIVFFIYCVKHFG